MARDAQHSARYYRLAAEPGVANAARYRERVARELDASVRLRAGELARAWLKAFHQRKPRGH